jgi:purine-nucleoside phosphorylase
MTIDPAEGAEVLRERLPRTPEVALVLGSGLGGLTGALADPTEVPFDALPGFPPSGVEGHAGRFVAGTLGERYVLAQAGRYHVYEGHPDAVVVAPVRCMAALGIGDLVLTNAAGGLDPLLEPGDLLLLNDHLNLMFRHPLVGPVRNGEARFPDMSAPYDPSLRELAMAVARELGIRLREGVYAAVTGPSYETPAEVRMLARMGAHAVGMSTVPEATVAAALGLRCIGFSMVTNKAAGLSLTPLNHEEVMEVGARAGATLARLLAALVGRLPRAQSAGAK